MHTIKNTEYNIIYTDIKKKMYKIYNNKKENLNI